MAHFARLDSFNRVDKVIVISNTDILDENGVEDENAGIQLCRQIVGNENSTWVQTSFNSSFRNKFAGLGYEYSPENDVFIEPKPYDSWTLNQVTFDWEPPVTRPSDFDTEPYEWNESEREWERVVSLNVDP